MRISSILLRTAMAAGLLLAAMQWSVAATEQSTRAVPGVDAQQLQELISQTEDSTSLDEARKTKLIDLYRRALTNLDRFRTFQADAEAFSAARNTAPKETQRLRQELEGRQRATPGGDLQLPADMSLAELEQRLQQEKEDLATVQGQAADLGKQLDSQAGRPSAARERLLKAQAQQEAVAAELKASPPAGESTAEAQARNWALETQASALSAEIDKLDRELLSHQARTALLTAQRDLAEQQVRLVSARVRALEDRVNQRRLADAERVQQETAATQQELQDKHPMVRELAERNLTLGEQLRQRALALEQVAAEDDRARRDAQRFAEELSTIRQKLEVAGLSQALGRVLMEQRRALPDLSALHRRADRQERAIADSSLRQIQYTEERRQLRDLDSYVAGLSRALPPEEAAAIDGELRELAGKRQELLDQAIATEASYLRNLGELDLAQRQLTAVIEDYDDFLAKRLLWIRSTEPVSAALFAELPQELARLASPSNWLQAGTDLLAQGANNPWAVALVLLLAALSWRRPRFLRAAIATGDSLKRIRSDRFTYTWQAIGWTALAAAPLPLLLWTLGWQLALTPDIGDFSRAVAVALMRAARDLLVLMLFTDVAVAGGLVVKHFRWPAAAAAKLHRELRLLMLLFLPAVFVTLHSLVLDRASFGGGLAVLALLIALGSVGLFVFRAFTPAGGVLAEFLAARPASLLARLRPVWLGALLAYISGLIALVLAGYFYTGGILTGNLIYTVWFVYLLILVRGLVVRWLLLVHRRLALKALLARREEARAAREAARQEKQEERPATGDDVPIEVEEREADLAALDAQSRKLLNTATLFAGIVGLWLIWSPVLPAFGVLEDVSLWSRMETVDGVDAQVPVTLADMALALIIAIITVAAARGLPAFLEFMLLQRTSITAGARFTATTLLRYVIVGVGIVLFFSTLGGKWSQIQWLVAALGVGIGFGLQEIVANFISGLIILFERPIRVGDIVTVGNTSGVVSRINIRATTITNWDRQELLVPNKEFITNQLLNWSLSDPITRVGIPVGVAYGSDVTTALRLMQEAAEENDNVLKDPAPILTFEGFGDNTLNLQLRAYLPSIEHRLKTITEINQAIDRKFKEAGVVIAFPQRDVHLDTNGPIDVRIHPTSQHGTGDS